MKKILVSLFIALFIFGVSLVGPAQAKTSSVRGYIKPSTGKYVTPYYKTTPNKTKLDNFSTKGNYNPYTGKKGTASPFKTFKLK